MDGPGEWRQTVQTTDRIRVRSDDSPRRRPLCSGNSGHPHADCNHSAMPMPRPMLTHSYTYECCVQRGV